MTLKKDHEDYIKLLNAGVDVGLGQITDIEIGNLPWVSSYINLSLSKKTVIFGENGVGKTMICELIKALNDKSFLKRWLHRHDASNVYCHIKYFKDQLEKYSIFINQNNEISYSLNDSQIPLLDIPLNILYIKESLHDHWHKLGKGKDLSLLEVMASYFGLTKNEFANTIANMRGTKKYFADDLYINEDEELIVNMGRNKGTFGCFSGGEKERVILGIILSIAKYYSKFFSTILIIERNAIGIIDDTGINYFLDICRSEKMSFQLILTLFPPSMNYNLQDFTSYELSGSKKEGVFATLI